MPRAASSSRIVQEGSSEAKIFPGKLSCTASLIQEVGVGYRVVLVCSPSGMGISRHSISTAETPLAPRLIHQTGPSSEVQEKPLRLPDLMRPLTDLKEGSKKKKKKRLLLT